MARLWPTGRFYAEATAIVLRAAWQAKRGRFSDERFRKASLGIRRAFAACGVPCVFENLEALEHAPRPCLVIGNHMSTAETFLLPSAFLPGRRVAFVVKRELVEVPIFKHIMRSQDPVVVGRADPRADLKAVLEGGAACLGQGRDLVIFPQRTRSVTFEPTAFNSIGVKLAQRVGVAVLPLALKTDAWLPGRWMKDFGPVVPARGPLRFAFGEPFRVSGSGREDNERIVAFISEKLAGWSAEPVAPIP